jgi:hypothetical protein
MPNSISASSIMRNQFSYSINKGVLNKGVPGFAMPQAAFDYFRGARHTAVRAVYTAYP